jgi:hypothetical protein
MVPRRYEAAQVGSPTQGISMLEKDYLKMPLPKELKSILSSCPGFVVPSDREMILQLAMGDSDSDVYDVAYDVPGRGQVVEATVTRCKNGLSINYQDPGMRRRDPDCLVVADEGPSDKDRFDDRFGRPFDGVRQETFEWLNQQELIVLPLYTGGKELGYPTLLVAPRNAAFFVGALADLQEMVPASLVPPRFPPGCDYLSCPTVPAHALWRETGRCASSLAGPA